MQEIRPQEGFQEDALSTPADIAFLGGAAGVGKTFTLLLEALRNVGVKNFGAVIFRRTSPQIRNEGALLDTSKELFPFAGGVLSESTMQWTFSRTVKLKFNHLQYDSTVLDWQGSQIPFIGFDELTHFTEYQFLYMLSRNRSTCGVKPYVRATMNPDPESWILNWIEWYIDQETGFPIPERSGVLRYFIRLNNNMIWGFSKKEVIEQAMADDVFKQIILDSSNIGISSDELIKSFTFIPGSIYANKKLLEKNASYLGNLLSLSEEEQKQLLHGNWKVSQDGFSLFQWDAINQIFDNYTTESSFRCITCDPAQFGRDFCVIFVWYGWTVQKTVIFTKSTPQEIFRAIESERQQHLIPKNQVLLDQDGTGGGTMKVSSNAYRGFSGGAKPLLIKGVGGRENYRNLKTQCFYKCAEENVNLNDIRINLTTQNCCVDGVYTTKIKVGSKVWDIRDLIKSDLRSMKKKSRDKEDKIQMNSKEEQKIYLNGRSPDFGDTIGMRKWFDLANFSKSVRKHQ